MSTKIVLQNVVISFPNLFTPRAPKGSDTVRYSASLILPQNVDWSAIKTAVATATAEKWPQGAPATLKSQISQVMEGPYKGHYAISANASVDHKPTTVDQNLAPIMDTSAIFAGCIVNAQVSFFGYDKGSNGVGVGLNMVQLVKSDGVTRLDNTQAAEEVFGKIAGAPPVTTAQAPTDAPVQTPVDSAPPVTAEADQPWN